MEFEYPIFGRRGGEYFSFILTIAKLCEGVLVPPNVENIRVVYSDPIAEEKEAMKLLEDIIEEEWGSLQSYIYFMRYLIYALVLVGVLWLVYDEKKEG